MKRRASLIRDRDAYCGAMGSSDMLRDV
jgi:hypothetical protein